MEPHRYNTYKIEIYLDLLNPDVNRYLSFYLESTDTLNLGYISPKFNMTVCLNSSHIMKLYQQRLTMDHNLIKNHKFCFCEELLCQNLDVIHKSDINVILGADEGFLGQILGIGQGARHPECQRMDHALVGANERFKSLRMAIPALQHPDFFLICVAHAASFYPIRQSGTTSPLKFLRGLPGRGPQRV